MNSAWKQRNKAGALELLANGKTVEHGAMRESLPEF
jgi:hypothetical protein